jgi:hypothetical protein
MATWALAASVIAGLVLALGLREQSKRMKCAIAERDETVLDLRDHGWLFCWALGARTCLLSDGEDLKDYELIVGFRGERLLQKLADFWSGRDSYFLGFAVRVDSKEDWI